MPENTQTASRTSFARIECAACEDSGWIAVGAAGATPCLCQREKAIRRELPARYQRAKLTDFSSATQEHALLWLSNPTSGLLLSGPVGSGKTYLAAACVRGRIENGKKALFRRMADFYAALRESYRINAPESGVLDPIIDAPLVVLDDLGAGGLTDFERRAALEILDRRLNDMKPSIVTTNWDLAEIAERMDDRIASRLASYTSLRLETSDRRLGHRAPESPIPQPSQDVENADGPLASFEAAKRNDSGGTL